MEIARKNVAILRRLIDQILDFRKYENGKTDLSLSEADLPSLLRGWASDFSEAARRRDIHLCCAAKSGCVVNVKKGQFLAPADMKNVVKKLEEAGSEKILLTERGASFGYNNLVVDMRSFPIMRSTGYPVIFDATHSVQLPGGAGTSSAGNREYVEFLARGAAGVGVDGFFMEVHDNPEEALCDGPNMVYLDKLEDLLKDLIAINEITKKKINK